MHTTHAISPCQAAWKSAANVGQEWVAAAPLAPKDGFYDERYRCKTMASFDMGDADDFEKLFCGDEEVTLNPTLTVTLTLTPTLTPTLTLTRTLTRTRTLTPTRTLTRTLTS